MHVTSYSCAWFFLITYINTKSRCSQIIYYSICTWDTARVNPAPCSLLPALFTCHPLFMLPTFYLLGEPAILLVVRIPIHSCPWFAMNCSPFATSPTLTHPIDQVTIFTETTLTTSAVPSDTVHHISTDQFVLFTFH
jgi:hypothetical protein